MEVVSNARSLNMEEFENTKAGVKGLVDLGLTKIPKFFNHPPESLARTKPDPAVAMLELPSIDLGGCDGPKREAIVEEIRKALETWGFFQIVNHSVPLDIMEGALQSFKRFYEQPAELKREYYSRDSSKKVRYFCNNILLSSQVAYWRDTLLANFQDGVIDDQALPRVCREEVIDYVEQVVQFRKCLSGLLSEALGLNRDYLESLGCFRSEFMACHYYPSCPEPELTMGAESHTDPMFLTILLQDDCCGFQVLHKDHWFDVVPMKGALVVNIGDMMQLITNDKFKSANHRVLVGRNPRMSIVCFGQPKTKNMLLPFGPIKELISEKNPPLYHPINAADHQALYQQVRLVGGNSLQHLKINDSST